MSSTSEPLALSRPAGLGREAKVIILVAVAHFISHIHIMLLPPILGSVKEAFGVSYTQVALALTAFNIASALLQTPAGFLVDRLGPRRMLIGGLLVGSVAIAVAALSPDYWLFVIAYGLLGLANTVYHPADYSILSAAVDHKRIGKAFSIHTFAGYLGSGITPALVLACAAIPVLWSLELGIGSVIVSSPEAIFGDMVDVLGAWSEELRALALHAHDLVEQDAAVIARPHVPEPSDRARNVIREHVRDAVARLSNRDRIVRARAPTRDPFVLATRHAAESNSGSQSPSAT